MTTREEIIAVAREKGLDELLFHMTGEETVSLVNFFNAAYAAGAAAENEACALVCDEHADSGEASFRGELLAKHFAEAIRARRTK
jgi:hypothetical protein